MNPTKTPKVLLAALIVAGTFGQATAAQAATASANATATIVQAIAISKTADLKFGQIVASSSAGTVTIAPAGTRTFGGGATNGGTSGTSTTALSAASFNVTGYSTTAFTITLPADNTITMSNGSTTMAVNSFTSSPSSPSALVGGAATVNVGATLTVAANQAQGDYTTTFNVTVDYQ